jgi:hypothetical protein
MYDNHIIILRSINSIKHEYRQISYSLELLQFNYLYLYTSMCVLCMIIVLSIDCSIKYIKA